MSEENKVVANDGGQELKRGIKGWQVAFIGLGGVIGSCYFLGVGWCIQIMGPSVFFAFLVVGVIVFGLMIAYAELLVNVPREGSFVAYTNEFLGPTLSVGMGWSFWFNWVCYCPSEAIAVSYALQALTGNTSPVAYVAFAVGTMLALTIINCCAVDIFAKIESGLAITKVCVIILFILLAFGIWIGLWGNPDGTLTTVSNEAVKDGFLGMSVNFGSGVGIYGDMFPNGFAIVVVMMVVVLVTFQGTEIVGLAAAESQNPDESVPKACRSVTYRIVLLYLLPILLVLLVYPTSLATDERPVFADIMAAYGLTPFFYIFLAVVLVAAFSCANTGFYGTVRCMYGLSIEGLAPKFLSRLSKQQAPRNAVLFTLAFMWVVLVIGLISELTGFLANLYGSLLSMSGFTGTLAWVGIILSQKRFRSRLKQRGYDPETCLKARVKPGLSWVPWFAMIAQLICLIMLAFGDIIDPSGDAGGGIVIFSIATSAVVIPMIVYWIQRKRGVVSAVRTLKPGEKSFDELFPPLNK
ncbi:MAG: amino acid permease [Clostridiales bacterium]|nr:amino acid permease [Clostridiales bacterium]MDD7036259.1 amino acid permease [Bacillota bacterium]MDY2921131.1 amino acid permease [Lentihominibacter sp.]